MPNRSFLYCVPVVFVSFLLAVSAAGPSRLFQTAGFSSAAVMKEAAEVPTIEAQDQRQLTALRFTVSPIGFDPEELTVTAGRYLIAVENRSGRRDLTFRFDRENGERLHEERQHRLDWRRQFDLHPGNYVLSEEDHPEWRSVIHVTPR
jgi:hypothetical protein